MFELVRNVVSGLSQAELKPVFEQYPQLNWHPLAFEDSELLYQAFPSLSCLGNTLSLEAPLQPASLSVAVLKLALEENGRQDLVESPLANI